MAKISTSERILATMAAFAVAGVLIKVFLESLNEKMKKMTAQKSNFVYTGIEDKRHAEILGEMSEINAKLKGIIRSDDDKTGLKDKFDQLNNELSQYE